MTSPYLRCLLAATLFLLGSLPVIADDPPAAATGDLWEVTSKMSMAGMNMEMPAQTQKVCAAKQWTKPPGGSDERQKCTTSEFKTAGNKTTWTVSCKVPVMTGKGEITRQSADAYTGFISFLSADGNMMIKLAGHKVGSCDNPS